MFNRILTISCCLLLSQALHAMPSIPNILQLPELPMFGDFNPNRLREQFNQFVGVEPDYAREKRMIDEIADSILDGDVEYLTLEDGREIFSIFMSSEADKAKGGVIVLHNRGHNPNWTDVIKPLRVGLAEKGWDTLSVQMPILDNHAKYYDYVPVFPYSHKRIQAAIDFYKQRGVKNIVLIAHGCGAHMSMSYFDKFGDDRISAFVGVGMGATDYQQKLINPYPLEKIKVPILDVFGQNDFLGVGRSAKVRKPRLSNKSAQVIIKNAGHYYQEGDSVNRLIDKIDVWLSRL